MGRESLLIIMETVTEATEERGIKNAREKSLGYGVP